METIEEREKAINEMEGFDPKTSAIYALAEMAHEGKNEKEQIQKLKERVRFLEKQIEILERDKYKY